MIFGSLGQFALGQVSEPLAPPISVVVGGVFNRRPMVDDFNLDDEDALLIWMMLLR
jgi:hypothetical protein